MKLLFTFIIFWSSYTCMACHNHVLSMFTIDNKQVEEAIQMYIDNEAKYEDLKNSIIILNIEKLETGIQIRLGAIDKKSVKFYFSESNSKPVGYLEYNDFTFFVLGQATPIFLKKTNNSKDFSFIDFNYKPKKTTAKIPPPPTIYEPVIYIFLYKNNNLQLIDVGRYTLSE